MTFEATIEARTLKHFVDVLQRVDCEAVFDVGAHGITCGIVSPDNVTMRTTKLDSVDCVALVAETQQRIGVDLDKLKKSLSRALQRDLIYLSVKDDALCIRRSIHERRIPLLNTEKLRKAPSSLELNLTAAFEVNGRAFKDIVSEAKDVGDKLYATAYFDEGYLESVSKHVNPETYCATLETMYRVNVAVESIYPLDILDCVAQDVARGDTVTIEFASDCPLQITYNRNGVSVVAILAPHVPDK